MLNFFSSSALADGTAAGAATPSLLENLLPFLVIFIAMYFFLILPQSRKAKEHQKLLSNLKNGDDVMTSSGILGKVRSISEGVVTLESGSSHLKVAKETVSKVIKS